MIIIIAVLTEKIKVKILSKLLTVLLGPFLGLIVSAFMFTANAFAYEACDDEDDECRNITGYNENLKNKSEEIQNQVRSMTDCAMHGNCENK